MTIKMKFKVSELIDVLNRNKENHIAIYDKAVVDYLSTVKKEHLESIKHTEKLIKDEIKRHAEQMEKLGKKISDLKGDIARVEKNKHPKLPTLIKKPEHRKEEYSNVIMMLKMTSSPEIELDNDQFSCYIQDKWIWQKQFLQNATQLFCSGSKYDPLKLNEDYFVPLSDSISNDYFLKLYDED